MEILPKESKGEKWKLKRPPLQNPKISWKGGSFWRKAVIIADCPNGFTKGVENL